MNASLDVDLSELISFGKYKGQPLSSIKDNVPYLKWCQNNLMDKDYFLRSSVYRAFFSNGTPAPVPISSGTPINITVKKPEAIKTSLSLEDSYELLYRLPIVERIKLFMENDFYKHLFQQIEYREDNSFFGLTYQVDNNIVSRQWSLVLSLTVTPPILFQSFEEPKLKELLTGIPGFEDIDRVLNKITESLRPLLLMNINNKKVVYSPLEVTNVFVFQAENVSYYQMGDLIQFALEGRKEKFYNRDFSTFILYQDVPSLTQSQADELGVILLKKNETSLIKEQISSHQRNLKALREKVMIYQEEMRSIETQIAKLQQTLTESSKQKL